MENITDEDRVKDKAQEVKNERDQDLEDIKNILATGAGMRFFKRFFREGKIFQTTFTGNSQTYFLEGHRNLALKFFSDVCEASPEAVAQLMIEGDK